MVQINAIGKLLAKQQGWKSLFRSEIELASLNGLGISIPKNATSAFKITGERANGAKADFYIFKNKYGQNTGSRSFYSDGTIREIDIIRGRDVCSQADGGLSHNLLEQFFDSRITSCHNIVKKGKRTVSDTTTFSEVYKMDNDIKKLTPEHFKKMTGYDKPENPNSIYQEVIRVTKTPQKDATTHFRQEVLDIKSGKDGSKTFLDLRSTMAKDGELTLVSMEHSPNVNIDTQNPYYQMGLLDTSDMLRAEYAKIVRERGLQGIEPPLILDDSKTIFNGKYAGAAGMAPRDNHYVGINMYERELKKRTKALQAATLGHECEHTFTQHADIHLAGIQNMKSRRVRSRKFYDGLVERFPKLDKESERYKKAQEYSEEAKTYSQKVWDKDGHIDGKAHASFKMEQDADAAGSIEKNLFYAWLNDMKKNFGLFNKYYAMKAN